jgi:WD40 repeat protein
LWDVSSLSEGGGREVEVEVPLVNMLLGHREEVTAVQWSQDGRALLSCSRDGTVLLWDFHLLARRTIKCESRRWKIHSAHWSPDSSMVAAVLASGQVPLYIP